MHNNKVAGSCVALVVIHALVELLIRRRMLRRVDLEHIIARLVMQARRHGGTELAAASEAGADVMRTWLLQAGDESGRPGAPGLRLVRKDE